MDKIQSITHISSHDGAYFEIEIKEPGRHGRTVLYTISEREGARLATELMRNLTLVAKSEK